jgi:hypothetical protein
MVALLSYPFLHWSIRKVIGSPDYGIATLWWAAIAIGLFWRQLGVWDVAVPIAGLLCPPSLRQLGVYYGMFVTRRRHAV